MATDDCCITRPDRDQIASIIYTRRAHVRRHGGSWKTAPSAEREAYLADADAVLGILEYMPTESEIREEVAREVEVEKLHRSGDFANGLLLAARIARREA